jgi:hypothetical protein
MAVSFHFNSLGLGGQESAMGIKTAEASAPAVFKFA